MKFPVRLALLKNHFEKPCWHGSSNEKHQIAKLNPDLFNSIVDKYLSESFKGNEFRY